MRISGSGNRGRLALLRLEEDEEAAAPRLRLRSSDRASAYWRPKSDFVSFSAVRFSFSLSKASTSVLPSTAAASST